MRRALALLPLPLLPLALLAAAAPDTAERRLTDAKTAATAAAARADRLDRAAAAARDAAGRARLAEAALTARVAAAEADIAAAEARVALVRRATVAQQAALAEQQGPVARLLAALQALAARPPLAALAQPGSVDDLVHVRAVLGSTLPVVRARTAGVRAGLDRTRALESGAARAAAALRDGRVRLEANRLALVRLEADQRLRAQGLGRDALYESDRALALGERARDIVGTMGAARDAAAVEASLATLSGPLPRPGAADPATPGAVYRLPVAGPVVTGFGELSDTGVRSRGLTLAPGANARVVAPAGGRIVYAGRFRRYGRVVVIDHGRGWTSALIGLGTTDVVRGDRVAAGDAIGRAGGAVEGDEPRVTVELRRNGRPVESAPLIG